MYMIIMRLQRNQYFDEYSDSIVIGIHKLLIMVVILLAKIANFFV